MFLQATMRQLHRYNSVRTILETPPDVGGDDPTKGLKGVGISGAVFEGPALVGVMGIDVDPKVRN
jgi:hypothetical protein